MLSDNLNNLEPPKDMDHVGTRMEHVTDLYEMWQMGLDILERYDKDSTSYAEKKKELETVLRFLRFYMMRDYDDKVLREFSKECHQNKPEGFMFYDESKDGSD